MGALIKNSIVNPRKTRMEIGRFYGIDNRVDGAVGAYGRAQSGYNFSVKDGCLKTCDGTLDLSDVYKVEQGVPKALFFYKRNDYDNGVSDNRLVLYTAEGKTYDCPCSGGTFTLIEGLTFDNQPIGVCYNYNSQDVIIFSSGNGNLYIYDGKSVKTVEGVPQITSMCIQNERLFLTSGGVDGALWFSDDFDPTNWNVSLNEAGFIDINDERGEMICAVAFAGYVYIFLSYGISRLTAFSDQSEFYLSHLLTSCGKIMKNSVTVCGDCITFMASDGIYRFDGYNATKISEPIDSVIDYAFDGVKGVYYNEYVYYKLKAMINGVSEHCLLKIMPDGSDYSLIYGGKISDLSVIKADGDYFLLCIEDTTGSISEIVKSGRIAETVTEKVWRSKESDFGIRTDKKVLDKISFYTLSDLIVTLIADGKTSSYTVTGKGWKTVRPRIRGNQFTLELKSYEEEVEVSGLTLDFSYYL